MTDLPLDGRRAIVSGANHGIGAATAVVLARLGADVAVTYLRYSPTDHDPGRPAAYRTQRAQGPEAVMGAIEAAGRRAVAIEADLRDPSEPERCTDEGGS
jgi:3-oxoacyl-[acyl-carrier protein] reductase